MKSKQLSILFILTLSLFLLSSCNSMIGIGLSRNKGTLHSDHHQTESGTGGFIEYRWKKMIGKDAWNNSITRHGFGADYNLSVRGYYSNYFEGADIIYQSVQVKYYYILLKPTSESIRLDLAAGLGLGNFPMGSLSTKPLISNLSLDLYFPNIDFLYLTSKVNYIRSFKESAYNASLEFGIGIRFENI